MFSMYYWLLCLDVLAGSHFVIIREFETRTKLRMGNKKDGKKLGVHDRGT